MKDLGIYSTIIVVLAVIGFMLIHIHMERLSCRANDGIYNYRAMMCFKKDAVLNYE